MGAGTDCRVVRLASKQHAGPIQRGKHLRLEFALAIVARLVATCQTRDKTQQGWRPAKSSIKRNEEHANNVKGPAYFIAKSSFKHEPLRIAEKIASVVVAVVGQMDVCGGRTQIGLQVEEPRLQEAVQHWPSGMRWPHSKLHLQAAHKLKPVIGNAARRHGCHKLWQYEQQNEQDLICIVPESLV